VIIPRILLAPEYVALDLPILGPFLPIPGTGCRPGSPFAIPGIENFCLGAFKLPEGNFTIPRNHDTVPRIITRPQIMDVSWPQVLMVYLAPRNLLPPGNDYTVLRIITGSQIMDVS
jgi:hypothetical protein